jgi:hypothetical protein
MRTAQETMKDLSSGDFVVCVQGLTMNQTLVAGVYWEDTDKYKGEFSKTDDNLRKIYYFHNGELANSNVTDAELSTGIIVGTEDKSFDLRDKIVQEIKYRR